MEQWKEQTAQLKQWVEESNQIVFFGGAGVSVPSGIPDFRGENGLYSREYQVPAEVILSHDYFFSHTAQFYDFCRKYLNYPDAKPNACHLRLAQLEKEGKLSAVITQNIDGLHQKAGSKTVLELHGNLDRNYCIHCDAFYDSSAPEMSEPVPHCSKCGGLIKPDVVLYGEGLDNSIISESIYALSHCDLCIVGGTSLSVWPAAGLIRAIPANAKLVIINLSPTDQDQSADLVIRGSIDEVFRLI